MTQGSIKKATSRQASAKRPGSSGAKKGQRTIAPKKKALAKQHKITKKYTAALIRKTEGSLAEKAGHLEMLGSGKKKGESRATEDFKKRRIAN